MIRSIRLTDEDRESLRFLLASFELTQRSFGVRAGVPQGWLSRVMSGKRPAVEPEMMRRMGLATQALLEETRQEGRLSGTEIEKVETCIAQLFGLEHETPKLIAPPGGAIPTYAANFIERPLEMETALGLLAGTPFTMSVEGGPLTGKTTFLKWFEEEAEKRGYEVAYLDCRDFAPLRQLNGDQLVPRFNEILIHIAEYLVEAWSLQPVETEGMRFTNWWLRMKGPLASGRPRARLLILDRVTRLGLELGEYLLKLIRNIHNARGPGGMSFALGVDADIVAVKNDVTRSDAYSVVQPRIMMRRLNEHQIREMLETVCGEQFNEEWFEAVRALAKERLHCQPYFVHAAANYLQVHHSVEALRKEVKDLSGDFQAIGEMEKHIVRDAPTDPQLKDDYNKMLAA